MSSSTPVQWVKMSFPSFFHPHQHQNMILFLSLSFFSPSFHIEIFIQFVCIKEFSNLGENSPWKLDFMIEVEGNAAHRD